MKNLTIASFLVAMSLTSAFAWERPNNPDRFISLGLNADYDSPEGTWGPMNATNSAYLHLADIKTESAKYEADVRFPLSNNVTITGRVRYTHIQSKYLSTDTSLVDSELDDQKGMGYGVGLRYYFNGK